MIVARINEPLERGLYEIGSPDLGRIYHAMDQYATRTGQ
jgi:hypothetical protein